MSALAAALLDGLQRTLPPPATSGLERAEATALQQVVTALALALERGELALDLEGPAPEGLSDADSETDDGPSPAALPWPAAHLAALSAQGWLVEAQALASAPQAPVVRDGRWLRWRRWHEQLIHCTTTLIALGQSAPEPQPDSSQLQQAAINARAAGLDAQQGDAVAALLQHRLVLLRGGPGTGKTSTVVQMLAAALRLQPQLRLQLAAPTGKAAARLAAAVAEGSARLEAPLAALLRQLPCGTLHRLLEARGDGAGFRRGRALPLELDLLVVDELSMVDLPLMAALLAALPATARLLLVGDPGQLAPVGPGAVLLELCSPGSLAALGPAAVELRSIYRNNGSIAELANSLRHSQSRPEQLLKALRPQLQRLRPDDNTQWHEAPPSRPPADALDRLRQHQHCLEERAADLGAIDPQQGAEGHQAQRLLQELERLILLSPVRRGPWGVETVQRALLGESLAAPLQHWPLGTPVLNRRNLAEQGLANGDIGVLVASTSGGRLVLFPGGRLLHPSRLGAAEPALALTVHMAQGSQYGELLLLLPESRQLEPRLIYTGLTRARQRAHLYTPVVEAARAP